MKLFQLINSLDPAIRPEHCKIFEGSSIGSLHHGHGSSMPALSDFKVLRVQNTVSGHPFFQWTHHDHDVVHRIVEVVRGKPQHEALYPTDIALGRGQSGDYRSRNLTTLHPTNGIITVFHV